MKQLTTSKLKKYSIKRLVELADLYATKLQWLHSTGKDKEDPEQYKRTALELYHVSELIENKKNSKITKKYKKYSK